jgi:hypothetical protein
MLTAIGDVMRRCFEREWIASRDGVCAVAMDPWAAYEYSERLDHICDFVLKNGVGVRGVVRQAVSD